MSIYGNAGVLSKSRGIVDFIGSLISSFSKTTELTMIVPINIYYRTKSICKYIEDEIGIEFGIEHFLMYIYMEFIKTSVQKYDPKKIYNSITRVSDDDDKIIIVINGNAESYERNNIRKATLKIEMDKEDAYKGDLILSEIYDLYGQKISLQQMIASLWVGFIEDYKRGENKKALETIIKTYKKGTY